MENKKKNFFFCQIRDFLPLPCPANAYNHHPWTIPFNSQKIYRPMSRTCNIQTNITFRKHAHQLLTITIHGQFHLRNIYRPMSLCLQHELNKGKGVLHVGSTCTSWDQNMTLPPAQFQSRCLRCQSLFP